MNPAIWVGAALVGVRDPQAAQAGQLEALVPELEAAA
jgi:hypothetical protein